MSSGQVKHFDAVWRPEGLSKPNFWAISCFERPEGLARVARAGNPD